jgi:peptidoglycan/xylan/chitin deacetylase (PgdA/CDA1 family)
MPRCFEFVSSAWHSPAPVGKNPTIGLLKQYLIDILARGVKFPFVHRKALAFADTYRVSFFPRPSCERRDGATAQILVYHRVLPQEDPFAIGSITLHDFQQQVRMLSSCFRVIGLDQLSHDIRYGRIQPGTVCITFDDGYQDNYFYAYPVLKAHNVQATFFLASDFIGTHRLLWHDQIMFALKNTQIEEFTYNNIFNSPVRLSDIPSRQRLAITLLEWLKQFEPNERDSQIRAIAEICEISNVNDVNEPLMLNWQQVLEMKEGGMSFGAHTKSHPILSTLSAGAQKEEIVGSKETIEDFLGTPVCLFAYPNGREKDYDSDTLEVLLQAGFECAVTTRNGLNTLGCDLLQLNREQPWERHPDRFAMRLLYQRLTS